MESERNFESIKQELQEIKEMILVIHPSTEEKYIPKTRMMTEFDLSQSTLRNREQDGSLIKYKIGNRSYYKMSQVEELLEYNN